MLCSTGDDVPWRAGQAPCLTGWQGPPPAVMAGRGSPRGWHPGAPSATARGSPGCNGRAPSAPARGSPGCNARAARHQSCPSVPGCNGQAPKGEGGSRSVGGALQQCRVGSRLGPLKAGRLEGEARGVCAAGGDGVVGWETCGLGAGEGRGKEGKQSYLVRECPSNCGF